MAYRETAQIRLHKDAQRQAILDAARRVVSRGGFREAQMATVAAEAGIATGTIYRYFPNQADLLTALFRANSQRELDVMTAALETGGSPRERLVAGIRTVSERALRNRRVAYAALGEPTHPDIETERLRFRRLYAQQLEQIIEQGMAAGEFPPQDANLSAAALIGAIGEALLGPLVSAAPSSRRNFVDSLLTVCLRTVGATPDHG